MTKKPQHEQQRRARSAAGPAQSVAIQQKIWMPVGMAIIMLAAVKKLSPSCGRPVANMWCTQSPKPRKPVATSDSTSAV